MTNVSTMASGDVDDPISSATTTAPGTPLALADIVLKKQRSTSNSSSESSGDSSVYSASGGGGSGRGSPLSPASSSSAAGNRTAGSPVKGANGSGIKQSLPSATPCIKSCPAGLAKIELFRESGNQYEPQTMVSRNLRDDNTNSTTFIPIAGGNGGTGTTGNGSNEMIFYIERPLEKIEERQTESESEVDNEVEEIKICTLEGSGNDNEKVISNERVDTQTSDPKNDEIAGVNENKGQVSN